MKGILNIERVQHYATKSVLHASMYGITSILHFEHIAAIQLQVPLLESVCYFTGDSYGYSFKYVSL